MYKLKYVLYIKTDSHSVQYWLMVEQQKLFSNREICDWGFMLISVKDQSVILGEFCLVFQFHKWNSNEVC